jgi:hypothetical protein
MSVRSHRGARLFRGLVRELFVYAAKRQPGLERLDAVP